MSRLSDSTVRHLLGDLWGDADVVLTELEGERDRNLRVDGSDGSSVLKVVEDPESAQVVELQVAALRRIARRIPSLPVPRVVPTVDGRAWADVDTAAGRRRVWRLTWLEGRPLTAVRPRRPRLLRELGRTLALLDRGLAGLEHPALDRPHPWDPARASGLGDALPSIDDPERRALVRRVAAEWSTLAARLDGLPRTVIHGDANDHNVVVESTRDPRRIAGVFDFGDTMRTRRVCEVAVAGAYAAFGSDDPVAAVAALVAGYDVELRLSDEELEAVFGLVRTRLALSVTISARRAKERPGNPYVTVSEAPAWATLARLDGLDPRWVLARLRDACGRPPFVTGPSVEDWLHRRAAEGGLAPILGRTLDPREITTLDLGVGSLLLGADPSNLEREPLERRIDEALADSGAWVGVGRWDEARPLYRAPAFATGDHPIDEHRTIHLGIDLFVPAGTPLHAPVEALVEAVDERPEPGDYGPVVLLRHEPPDAPTFWTLWGHLDPEVLLRLRPGMPVAAGDLVARVGAPPRNGDWPPHLHLQLAVDPLDRGCDLPGVAPPRERSTWRAWFPDPSVLCGLEPGAAAAPPAPVEALVKRRRRRLGTGLALSYRRPLHLVRGWRQFLYDAEGRAFLDLYNNVPHVGHGHPAVVEAVSRQLALLNTNTRYLHETILEFADAIAARMPAPLEVVWVVNSASEANELALRLARSATGRRTVVVQEAGYHGHTTGLIDVSPYKFDGPGGEGRPPWVDVVPVPDDYRGRYRREEGDAGARYGDDVARRVAEMTAAGRAPGAFLAETFPSVGGQIVPPDGYLERAYAAVRDAGGICIADEVQTGFGRLGDAFWGFELQQVVPDVVVLGKPAGNGVPLAAVVATRAVAEAFGTEMEFFSTFGGNPVSCAAGLAVLRVLEEEELPAAATRVGSRLLGGLRSLARDHPVLGDVRGRGLFIGVELVRDPVARQPAPEVAAYVVERLREAGILAGTDGPEHNVLKLRGPLVVDEVDADRFLAVLEAVLGESGAQP